MLSIAHYKTAVKKKLIGDFMNLKNFETETCPQCEKKHVSEIKEIIIEKNAIEKIGSCINLLKIKKPFILADKNTFLAAGKKVCDVLSENDILFSKFVFMSDTVEPDEWSVGSAVMHYDKSCDGIIAIGSGVINDIGKILSSTSNIPYIIVATAPSMDGYASSTSSMVLDGLKVTIPSKCADIIIGDADVLRNAPLNMLKSGLGDMIAKYISICEWRIASIVCGEYYCEKIADLVRTSLEKCVQNAKSLLARDENAVVSVFEGLIICGVAMAYAGVSRPASGVEHYFSHVWDMRALEFGTKVESHGIQCALGTLLALKLYNKFKEMPIDKEKAISHAKNFDFEKWSQELSSFIGKGAAQMILAEKNDKKYDINKHIKRLNIIINNYDKIISIIEEELPKISDIENLFDIIAFPTVMIEGENKDTLPLSFKATKDIRFKYVLSHLLWDLGIINEISEELLY